MSAILDSHVHVWDRGQARYDWLTPADGLLYDDFHIDDAVTHLATAGVRRAILVQAADNHADTTLMLDSARLAPAIAGIVGWAPLDDVSALERCLQMYDEIPLLVGIRTLIHTRRDPLWLLREPTLAGLRQVAKHRYPYEIVTSDPEGLRIIPTLSDQVPDISLVIDHLGKPPLGAGRDALAPWEASLRAAACNPRVSAKLSGLYAVGSYHGGDLSYVVRTAVDIFGPTRLMYGGDWPVCLPHSSYQQHLDGLLSALEFLDEPAQAQILHTTAENIYGLSPSHER